MLHTPKGWMGSKALRYIQKREIRHEILNTEMLDLVQGACEAQMVRKQTHSEKGPWAFSALLQPCPHGWRPGSPLDWPAFWPPVKPFLYSVLHRWMCCCDCLSNLVCGMVECRQGGETQQERMEICGKGSRGLAETQCAQHSKCSKAVRSSMAPLHPPAAKGHSSELLAK